MNKLHDSATSHRTEHNKKYFENFLFVQWWSVCTEFVELSMAHLLKKMKIISFSQAEIYAK
jgi:hypothetical protein